MCILGRNVCSWYKCILLARMWLLLAIVCVVGLSVYNFKLDYVFMAGVYVDGKCVC